MDMQRKWSTTEQEAYGVFIMQSKNGIITSKRAEVIVSNDHKPLARFL